MRHAAVAAFAVALLASRVATADAPMREVRSFDLDASLGWERASVFGRHLDLMDARIGIGATIQRRHGFGVDVLWVTSAQLGGTESNRSLYGFELLGAEVVLHGAWMRLHVGGRWGGLGEQRSTQGPEALHSYGDAYLGLAVEPYSEVWLPVFAIEAHAARWGGVSTLGFELLFGVRYCSGCAL